MVSLLRSGWRSSVSYISMRGRGVVWLPRNSARSARPMLPAMYLRTISMELTHAKELLQSAMEELHKKKEADGVK